MGENTIKEHVLFLLSLAVASNGRVAVAAQPCWQPEEARHVPGRKIGKYYPEVKEKVW